MTAPEQVASTAQQQAGAVAGTAKDQAASVAQTATGAASEVTGTAKEQVGNVVGETVAQAKDLTGQVRQQAAQQMTSQTDKAASALRDLSKQLSEGDTSGVVGTVLTEVGTRVQGLADALEQKGPQGLLDDVRRYARRNPGTFVLGAGLAGLVAGRLAKGMTAKDETPALPAGTATRDPLAGRTSSSIDTGVTTYPGTSTAGTAGYPATSVPGNDPFGGDTYGAGTPAAGTPAYGEPATSPYPSGGSPYSAGYGTDTAGDAPYGTRGTL